MKFLLDTDICIYALKQHRIVLRHLLSQSRSDVAISVIVEFTSDDAIAYAGVRAKLERSGTPIGPLDTLIAAQAVARRLVLVSNNGREFGRVTGLRIENWTA